MLSYTHHTERLRHQHIIHAVNHTNNGDTDCNGDTAGLGQ